MLTAKQKFHPPSSKMRWIQHRLNLKLDEDTEGGGWKYEQLNECHILRCMELKKNMSGLCFWLLTPKYMHNMSPLKLSTNHIILHKHLQCIPTAPLNMWNRLKHSQSKNKTVLLLLRNTMWKLLCHTVIWPTHFSGPQPARPLGPQHVSGQSSNKLVQEQLVCFVIQSQSIELLQLGRAPPPSSSDHTVNKQAVSHVEIRAYLCLHLQRKDSGWYFASSDGEFAGLWWISLFCL